ALEPRESTTIEVRIDPRRFTGPKACTVHVTVGPEFVSTATLKLSANSRPDPDAQPTLAPSRLSLGAVKLGEALTRRVIVRGPQPFRIWGVGSAGEGVTLDAPPDGTEAQAHTLNVRCQLERPGPFRRELRLLTSAQEAPLTLTIDGDVVP